MTDPYRILGIQPGASDDEIKKAYRAKCKLYHPDLNPGDTTAEEKFKEVQTAYSEIMKIKQGGGSYSSQSSYSRYGGSRQGGQYQDPFGFGFDPFGFNGSSGSYGYSSQSAQEEPRMRAARNYINYRRYQEAMTTLESIPIHERRARWHYYAALANSGMGNQVNALEYARKAVELEPDNYEYQNLLSRLQNYSRSYQNTKQTYQVHTYGIGRWCLTWFLINFLCNCFCRGGYFWC